MSGLTSADGGVTWNGTLTADAGIAVGERQRVGDNDRSVAGPCRQCRNGWRRRHAGVPGDPDDVPPTVTVDGTPFRAHGRSDRHRDLHLQRIRARLRQHRRHRDGRNPRADHVKIRPRNTFRATFTPDASNNEVGTVTVNDGVVKDLAGNAAAGWRPSTSSAIRSPPSVASITACLRPHQRQQRRDRRRRYGDLLGSRHRIRRRRPGRADRRACGSDDDRTTAGRPGPARSPRMPAPGRKARSSRFPRATPGRIRQAISEPLEWARRRSPWS